MKLRDSLLLVAASMAFAANTVAQTPLPPGMGPPPGPPTGAAPASAETNPPLIDSVSYRGNQKIATELLAKDSAIKPGIAISRPLVGGEIQRIVALYKQSGFDLSVSPDIAHPADGHVTVTFVIDEAGKGGNGGAAPGGPRAGGPPPGPR
jgi:Surface antigen variable number repeat